MTHREDIVGLAVERDDRGFVEDDAASLGVDERVRGAQVDGEVARQSRLLDRSA
jgi:hypothetical protein